ncbi:TolC family protein [Sunxiuqinia indica]|uniref:TolC family protein n=1 Tax=Sunxiuqinia indica TaxID=2692584 RepID=UPI00135B3277|nr:TolC family protein [Sunxiuqinia indica]
MKITYIILLTCLSLTGFSQTKLDEFLDLVEQNNQELIAARQFLEAEKAGFQTGLTPDNPSIEYGYFPGSKDEMGTKTTYGISQAFEFPTVYSVKKKLANNQSQLSELDYQVFRQNKLLEAKLSFYNYAFLLKKKQEYQKRLEHSTQLLQSYQTNFDKGNTSILDLNKAKIQNLKIKSSYQILLKKIDNALKDLTLFAGTDTIDQKIRNAPEVALQSLETILAEFQQLKPEIRYLSQAQQVAKMNIQLAKQNWLPEFEIGYEAEKEPDGTYKGLHAGLSLPLWKNKNTVQHARAQADFKTQQLKSRIAVLINEKEKLYFQVQELDQIRKEYQLTLEDAANVTFLDKALRLGQMSVIEYFNELAFYYETIDSYLEIEKAHKEALARLTSYKL